TVSQQPLPDAMASLPSFASLAPGAAPESAASDVAFIVQKTALPQLNVKLLFKVGSANDPKGKEGLAELAAAMVAEAGSRDRRIDEINKALFPMAGAFRARVDKEMTTFTGSIHRDNWKAFFDIALPMLLEPGLREEDFKRLKDAQWNALKEDLRSNNEEELGKERLQANIFAGTPYGHPAVGTLAGIAAITLDDVKAFLSSAYTRANLVVGLSGDLPTGLQSDLTARLAALPEGPALAAPTGVTG